MATSDPTEVLLTHHRWAMRNLLHACAKLTPEQFHQRFDMGPGSLHDTALHMLGALRGWGDLLAGRDQRPRIEQEGTRTPEQMRALLEEITDDIENSVRAHPPGEIVTGSRGGRSYSFARGAVMTHVMTHGMHHRAQCLNMLRHLGVDPLPHVSVVEWMLMADGAGA